MHSEPDRPSILFFAPAGEYGGAGSLLRLLEPGRAHFFPIVVCPAPSFLSDELERLGVAVHPFETHKHRLSRRPDWHVRMIVYLAVLMRRNRVDAVVVNHGGNFPIIAYAAKLARVPLVRFIRRTLEQNKVSDYGKREKSLLGTCAGLIFISKFIENEVKSKLAEPLPNWVQIYNPQPIPSMDDKAEPAEVRKRFGVSDGEPVVGVFGSIYDAKGQDIMVEAIGRAIEKVPRIKVLIVGDALNTEFLAMVKLRIEELGLGGHFVFTGFQKEVTEIMRACDFTVLPSRSEALGRVVLEAWSVGSFVIGSSVDGMREIIEDADGGYLFCSEDPDDLAARIVDASSSKDRCQEMAERGRSWVATNCDPKRYAERFTKFVMAAANLE